MGIWRAQEETRPMKKYRPVVTIVKEKKGMPTVVYVSGKYYVLADQEHFQKVFK